MDYRRSRDEFEKQFGTAPGPVGIARAPYRVCPLGAHTDHQRGLVIGFTLEPAVDVVFRARADRRILARSRDFPGEADFELGEAPRSDPGFGGYLRGIARRLVLDFRIERGADIRIEGDLKPGGVASSAAVEVAFLLAMLDVNGIRLDRERMMSLVVAAEQESAGVLVGLLDPAVILFGEKDHLVFLDCAEGIPRVQQLAAALPRFEFLLVDAGGDRDLRTSPYNERVLECQAAARALGATGDPPVLREVTLEQLRLRRKELDPVLARRAEHVLSENKRVRTGLAALQQGDLRAFGRLVNASGQSMVRLFDAGTPETTQLMQILQADPEVIGATLNGAGFGGSVLAIVPRGSGREVIARVTSKLVARFPDAAGRSLTSVSGIGPGAGILS